MVVHPRHKHPYEDFVASVSRPARYIGGEYGQTVKPWSGALTRVALAFPDAYEIGMSHLGFKILYSILAKDERLLAERVYAPWPDMEAALRARDLPLCTLESGRALREFDVVGFSLQFELTYTNVLLMLDLGGIPIRAEHRGESDPLVIAGGPTATHPEPMAPFFDAIVIGDAERKLPELLLADAEHRQQHLPRAERLRRWAAMGGVYVPALYETRTDPESGLTVVSAPRASQVPARVRRTVVDDLVAFPFPSDGPVASTETVFSRFSVEIARGCTEGCRFCQAGMIYRPVRERDPRSIIRSVLDSIDQGGYDEVSLTSLSTADHSCISVLVERAMHELRPKTIGLGVSSLRAYGLGDEVLDDLARARATGLTFAPEAGTQRMRDVINKNVTEQQLLDTAERVFSRGWHKVKLYFMIGLPTEQDDDVRGIIETAERTQALGRRILAGRKPIVTVSVSTHVPKPHTPFQWAGMDILSEVERKQALLRGASRNRGVDLKTHDARASVLEAILARGDRDVARAIEAAYRSGCRFDSWDEQLSFDRWQVAFAEAKIDVDRILRPLPLDATLPWSHIDVGLEDGFLAREYKKALRNRLSPPCGKPVGAFVHHTNLADATADERKLVCYDCGIACDLTKMRQERIDALSSLGARERRAPRPRSPKPARAPSPPTTSVSASQCRVRLVFGKVGAFALTSHLDLVRNIPRVFRRAGLEMAHSQGFNPKPRMTLGPALPLGVQSLGEVADVVLTKIVDPKTLPARLTALAPEGFRFSDASILGPDDPSIARVLVAARYLIAVGGSTWDEGDLSRRLADLREGRVPAVHRERKGREVSIDVARFVESVEHVPASRAADLGLAGEGASLELCMSISSRGGARASDVAVAIFGADTNAVVVRLGLLAQQGGGPRVDPLDLEALRSSHAGRVDRDVTHLREY